MPDLHTSDGVRLHYRLDGPPDAPPLVLLHGLGSDAQAYDPLIEAIGERMRVARLDLRGHGRSEPLTDPAGYGWFQRAATDVVELCDELSWRAPGLAGGSLGAATATATVVSSPSRVGRIALVHPAIGAGPDMANPVAQAFVDGVRDHGLLGILAVVVEAFPEAIPAAAVAEARVTFGRQDDAAMRACCASLGPAVLLDDPDALARIAVPTLVVAARGDALHPWEIAVEYSQRIPGARLDHDDERLAPPARVAAMAERLVGFFGSAH